MRLLNAHTIRLQSFDGAESDIPPYTILSHTWGNKEITFQNIIQQPLENLQRREAFYKVQECCAQARRNGYDYVWIDTCCIDKTSSAELSEAINSMFKWYQQASLCYVFLSDFDTSFSYHFAQISTGKLVRLQSSDTSFFSSRWFTRGWPLQELFAQRRVIFFDKYRINFGSRDDELLDRLCHKTGIWPQLFDEPRCHCLEPYPAVRDGVCVTYTALDTLPQTLGSFTVSIKMTWASSRITTRKEDSAYCLLGLFNLNMPMLYGEGDKAFLRLQEAIVRQSKDQSILLWRGDINHASFGRIPGCLAPLPSVFNEPVHVLGRRVFKWMSRTFEGGFMGSITPIELTDTAIQMYLWICPCTVSIYNPATEEWFDRKLSLGILDLAYDDDYLIRPALFLEHLGTINLYRRVYHMFVVPVDPRQVYSSHEMSVDQGQSNAFANAYPLTYPSVLKARRYLNQATQKNVEIMRYQSPVNAVSMNPSYDLGLKTGPVYLVSKTIRLRYTSNRKRRFRYTMSDRGSHPPLSRYDTRATQIPSPWVFEKCQHPGVDRHFGGIHFLSFFIDNQSKNDHSQNDETAVGHVAITWGMHRQVNADGGGYTPWSPWCRAFNMLAFIEYAGTSADDVGSLEMYHGSHDLHPPEIQVRLEGQRRRLCLASWQNLCIPQNPEDKALFPSSCEDGWAEDQMHNIANDPVMNTHLAIRIVMIEGLGRTLYEVQFDIDQAPKALQSFDEQ
ncbi:hypothetical protein HYE67_009917 [Fusarium culmorum]|uniref:Heterokaryon incompatibility domain-containing protein n=1 Tax=Fusarium culmorum TaxID=5516 RepID=A0A7S8DFU2_FUSCU|nr:hypothetical protein HYE67_009917 [Fusarium culmorum]